MRGAYPSVARCLPSSPLAHLQECRQIGASLAGSPTPAQRRTTTQANIHTPGFPSRWVPEPGLPKPPCRRNVVFRGVHPRRCRTARRRHLPREPSRHSPMLLSWVLYACKLTPASASAGGLRQAGLSCKVLQQARLPAGRSSIPAYRRRAHRRLRFLAGSSPGGLRDSISDSQ